MLGETSPLKLGVPCGFDDMGIMYCIYYLLRKFLPTGHIDDPNILIIKCIGKEQDVKVTLNIAVYTTVTQINIAIGFQVDR